MMFLQDHTLILTGFRTGGIGAGARRTSSAGEEVRVVSTELNLVQDALCRLMQLQQAVLDLQSRLGALEELEEERKRAYEGFLGDAGTQPQTRA